MRLILSILIAFPLLFASCMASSSEGQETNNETVDMKPKYANDVHSYSKPNEAVVTHLNWSADINFDTKIIHGMANWTLEKAAAASSVIFDTRGLTINAVKDEAGNDLEFSLGENNEILGQPLTVSIPENVTSLTIDYLTSPDAGALLWVEGDSPFLFTQSQAILGRTWIPCQDSPGIRFTYDARVKVPQGLMALMSAENPQAVVPQGAYTFKMEQPIPSYLMALAVGNVEFRPIGERCGVYAVPSLIDASEYEFAETEQMLIEAEKLYGKYAWGRYDLLILPPAFPFGGMENPRLTFATPTIIAGDRSLTALVAHEMAHSWSGNLVTNSTWDDFWLNEGFTVYFEQRIMEAVYGREISEMLALLSYQGLVEEEKEIHEHHAADTHLKLDLDGRDPDDGMSAIAYDKGYFFLRLCEETVGRERWDAFLQTYFQSNAFKVMDTERFVDYISTNLLSEAEIKTIDLNSWIYGPGIPANCPVVKSERIEAVDKAIADWANGTINSSELDWNNWVYQERYRFLTNLPANVGAERLAELDGLYKITETGNNEVLFAWLEQSVLNKYDKAYPRLESFLVNVGRRKFLTPLYTAMINTGQADLAKSIYAKARPNYHSVATGTMDELLGMN